MNDRYDYPSPVTDTERVSEWAATALREGRIELGHALAQVAVRAARAESRPPAGGRMVNVPLAGATRIEQPARPIAPVPSNGTIYPAWQPNTDRQQSAPVPADSAPLLQVVRDQLAAGPTGDGDAELARAESDATSVMGQLSADIVHAEGRRCEGKRTVHGVAGVCLQGIYYDSRTRRWQHIDPMLDVEHKPVAPPDGTEPK